MSINEDIRDRSIAHAVFIERYKAGLVKRVLELLGKTDADLVSQIAARLAKIEERGYDLGPATTRRLLEMKEAIRKAEQAAFKEVYAATRADLMEFAGYEAGFQAKLLESAAAPVVSLKMTLPARGMLNAVVTDNPFQGRLLKEWFGGLAATTAQKLSDAVSIGIVEGQTTDQIVRRIIGTRARSYQDGLLAISRRDAANIVGTATAHVAGRAKAALYDANPEVVLDEVWISTLDSKTCESCAVLDGKTFKRGEGPPTPRHFGPCRCQRLPYFGPSTIVGKRASQFGPVPETTTYQDWLKRQPAAVQDEVLGKARAKLFRDGNLPLDRFLDVDGKTYTLQELAARDAGAFDSVFGGGTVKSAAQRIAQEAEFKAYLGEKTYERMSAGVEKAMKESGVPSYGLSQAERVAIHAYTTGDKYYDRLNSALRSGDAVSIARVAPMANVLDEALNKLPSYEGPVLFRVTNLPEAAAKSIQSGGRYSDPAFMSASKVDMGTSFGDEFRFTIVASAKGKEIAGFSAFKHEQEVLFPRGSRFDIIKAWENRKTGFKEVILSDAE